MGSGVRDGASKYLPDQCECLIQQDLVEKATISNLGKLSGEISCRIGKKSRVSMERQSDRPSIGDSVVVQDRD